MPKFAPTHYQGVPVLATYNGGTQVAVGTAGTSISVPASTTSAIISFSGDAGYFKVNGTIGLVGTVAPAYVSVGQFAYIPPIDNFTTLGLEGAGTASVAYVQYFQDA